MVEVKKGNWMCLQEMFVIAVISVSDRVSEEERKTLSDGKSKEKQNQSPGP